MRINSKAVIGLERGKVRIDNINTFPNIDVASFSIVDVLQIIDTEVNRSNKHLLKQYNRNSRENTSLTNSLPFFQSTLDTETQSLNIRLIAGFLLFGTTMCQQGDVFVHDLKTNLTSLHPKNKMVKVHYRLTRSPVMARVGVMTDSIMSELDIHPAYFPRFGLRPMTAPLNRDWYTNILSGETVSSFTSPFIFLEIDVRGAIKEHGDDLDTPISVMLSNNLQLDVSPALMMARYSQGVLNGLMRQELRSVTITFKPSDVVDGNIVVAFSMPHDNIEANVLDYRTFVFGKHCASYNDHFSENLEMSIHAERAIKHKRRLANRLNLYYAYQIAIIKQLCEFKSSFME